MSRRSRYERANTRGGLGVRKRLSEESQRSSYRLNGVQTGSVVARAYDKYFADFTKGYDLGVIVRKTASTVQIRWVNDEDITSYDQGDARYEVDRGRWRILGVVRGNPLDPFNPITEQLARLREAPLTGAGGSGNIRASESLDSNSTDQGDRMPQDKSNAAREREAAQKALANGELKDRETYTAKQVASRCGTDPKTMRKFFRSNHSTVEPVGQGGRYEFDARDLPQIKREFASWQKKIQLRAEKRNSTPRGVEPEPEKDITLDRVADAIERAQEQDSPWEPHPDLADVDPDLEFDDQEPSAEDLAELDDLELELEDQD